MKIVLSALRFPVLLRLAVLFCSAQSALAQPTAGAGPFWIDGKPPTRGCLCIGENVSINTDIADSPMLREIGKIAGVLDAKAINRLRRSLGPAAALDPDHDLVGTLRVSRGKGTKDLAVSRMSDGTLVIVDPASDGSCFPIDPVIFGSLGLNQAFITGIEQSDPTQSFPPDRLDLPYFESPVALDTKTRRARLKHRYPDLTRALDDEQMRIRMPRDTESDQLPGILVWISPSPNGKIPRIFHSACDELNLIAIGVDNNGNTRELTDRLQIHLDSIATVQAHYRIDTRRVYVTGMSGGGRCSSILQLAFPDIFMGSVPIVGLDSYHRTPTGAAGKYWPERLGRPAARWFRMLKDRRIAAITGSMDFNAPEMRTRSEQMKADKINIRLDVIDGMGHTMPSSEQFAEALEWVDALQQDRIVEASEKAQRVLDGYLKRMGSGLAVDPKARKILIGITIDAPWSEASWVAARLLGVGG